MSASIRRRFRRPTSHASMGSEERPSSIKQSKHQRPRMGHRFSLTTHLMGPIWFPASPTEVEVETAVLSLVFRAVPPLFFSHPALHIRALLTGTIPPTP